MSSSASSLGPLRLTLEKIPLAEGIAPTWGDSVANWESYVSQKANKRLVFVGDGAENRDEILTAPYSHRFREEYTRMQYAKIQSFIRGALSDYSDPHLAILTFSTSTLKPNGEPRPPLDHMDELLSTWGAGVYYELNQVLDGTRKSDPWGPVDDWEYLFILEPTTDRGRVGGGYAHAHVGIVVDGEVSAGRFESVIGRHLIEAPNATGDAHELEDAVVVKPAAELNNPGAYLFKYLGKSWDTEGMEDYEKRFASLLFETGHQRFRASNGAQKWMRSEESEASEPWIFAGVLEADKAAELGEYDDAEEFRLANECGVRSWLNAQRPAVEGSDGELLGERFLSPDEVAAWEPSDPWEPTPYDFGSLPSTGSAPEGDRPPP